MMLMWLSSVIGTVGGQKPSMNERVGDNGWRGGSGSGGTTTELSVTTNRMI